jgi:pimeloyl-ACP methyl ester carboxylesterase
MSSNAINIQLPTGVQLQYIRRGDLSAIPIVFLHGFTGSWREFEPILEYLPEDLHAIAITLRGHGEASHPETGYGLSHFSADVEQLLKALEIDEVVIVGHSMGSAIAQRFALDNSGTTLGLVLVSAVYPRPGDPNLQAYFDSTVSKLEDPIDPEYVRQFLAIMRVKPIPEELFEIGVQEALRVPARVWMQAFEGRLKDRMAEEFDRIQCPTLLIWGDRDHRSLEEDQDALLREIRGSQLRVYPGCGHLVHIEEPRRFALDIAAFWEETVATGAT